MTKLQVGRFGVEVASGEIQSVSDDGSKVSFNGVTAYSDVTDAATLRQQLLGLRDGDESFVPVVWPEQPEFDGYYRPTGVSVSGGRGRAAQGVWEFTIELERVQGFASPLIESTMTGLAREGSQVGTVNDAPAVVPDSTRSWAFFNPALRVYTGQTYDFVRAGAGGDMLRYSPNLASAGGAGIAQFYLPPDRFYDGAATLYAGSAAVAAVGRQIPATPGEWLLDNGLIQVRPLFDDDFTLEFRYYSGSGWGSWQTLTFYTAWLVLDPREVLPAPHAVTVLWNSPECVVIRLSVSLELYPATFDLVLRRGARYVAVELNGVQAGRFGVVVSGFTTAPTETTGYMYRAVTGSGTVFVAAPYTLDWLSGGLVIPYEDANSYVQAWSFAFGATPNAGDDTVAVSVNEYFWAGSEVQRVVAR